MTGALALDVVLAGLGIIAAAAIAWALAALLVTALMAALFRGAERFAEQQRLARAAGDAQAADLEDGDE